MTSGVKKFELLLPIMTYIVDIVIHIIPSEDGGSVCKEGWRKNGDPSVMINSALL